MRVTRCRRILGIIALSPIGFVSTPLAAQEQSANEEPGVDEVIVTSSRIRRPEETFSSPVVAIEAQSIQNAGVTSLSNFLKEMPALAGSLDANDAAGSNAFIGGTGLSLLNLRNLGEERTLVLVDGRRHVAALPGTAAVDVDTIPLALVERVEVQTGGASAIYGADGVSGVVNFIMKKDFEGVDVRTQVGRSTHGDAESRLFSAAAGLNFHEDRGNFTFALEYAKDDRLAATRRDYSAGGQRRLFMDNPYDRDDDPNIPDHVPLNDIRFYDSSPGGAIDVDFDFYRDLNADGTPFDNGVIPPPEPFLPSISSVYQQGGDGTPLDRYVGDLLPEIERYTANAFVNYELAPAARVFAELKYSTSQSFSESQPSFDFFIWLEPDYAFTPASIAAAAGADNPILMSRDHFDLGIRNEDIDRETIRSVFGIGGDLTDNIRYEVSYVYGQTEVDNTIGNNRYNDRFAAALDAVIDPGTGSPTCRSNLDPTAEPANISWLGFDSYEPVAGWAGSFTPGPNSGCVPLNLFGEGSPSQAAIDWIMTTSHASSKIKQHVAQAYVSGTTSDWFELPAGGVGFALGGEWREESSEGSPPLEDQLGLTFGNVLQPDEGEYDVSEVFAEISIPLISRQRFAEVLSLDGAVRLSDYSTTGSATTWKVGAIWAPTSAIALRGTRAEATRAPNIDELFAPSNQDFESIPDPCDVTSLDEGSGTRAANCAALLSSLGVDPATFTDPNSAFVGGISRGNSALDEEVAETTTFGIVLRPQFAPNLAIAIDWYQVELTNAISTATAQEAAEICVDSPSIENEFCGLITREAGTGAIVDFLQQPVNVADFRTEGYDFTVNYRLDPASFGSQRDYGTFNLRLIGNKLEKLTFIRLPGSEPDPELGEEDKPEWQANFDLSWERGPFLVNYGINYFDETYRYTYQERTADRDIVDPEYSKYDAKLTHDVQVRYGFANGLSIYGGINNLTDQEPDVGEDFYPVNAVGRAWYLGATFNRF